MVSPLMIGFGAAGLLGGLLGGKKKGNSGPTIPYNQHIFLPGGGEVYRENSGRTILNAAKNPLADQMKGETDNRLLGTIQQLPNSFNVNDMFNNPYYESTLGLLRRPIESQQRRDENELTANLNARNQMGSSFDALMRDNMARRYDGQFRDAENQARLTSQQAFQQNFNNLLSQLGALRNDRTAALQQELSPIQLGLQALGINSGAAANQGQLALQQQQLQQQQNNNLLGLIAGLAPSLIGGGGRQQANPAAGLTFV